MRKQTTRMTEKLRSRAGESIAEVLVALLISVLGIALLVGMIGASTHIIDQSTGTMQSEYSRTVVSAAYASRGSVTIYSGSGSAASAVASFSIDNQTYSNGASTVFYTPRDTSP